MIRSIVTIFCAAVFCLGAKAQDTTWVQTYTFDTIVTRRATFEFPASLEGKRFEKVLMYYKLKCSPLTTWDQYDCGEWDYLTYTRIFDHTGVWDSVRVDGMRYRLNTQAPASVNYFNQPYFDKRWKQVSEITPNSVTQHAVPGTAAASVALAANGTNGTVLQWIIPAADLSASGATTGNIQGLELSFLNAIASLEGVKIRIKNTALTTLTAWETTGFTTVFDNNLSGIASGNNAVYFSTPYNWDGASNIVVEITVSDANAAASLLAVNGQESGVNGSVSTYNNLNGVFRTTAADYAEVNLSNVDLGGDVTIMFWAKGNGAIGTNTSILEAVDSLNRRIFNIHMPWSDNTVYFDAGSENGSYDRISKVTNASDMENWHHWAFVKKTSTGQMFIYRDGVQWHVGNGLNRPVGKVARFFLGSNWNQEYQYKGDIDEFSVWTSALPVATIAAWKDKKIDGSHPNYSALQVCYDFDDVTAMTDRSGHDRLGMCSADNMVVRSAYPVSGRVSGSVRPAVSVIQGTMNAATTDSVLVTEFPNPKVLFEYEPSDNSFHIINNEVVYLEGTIDTLNVAGTVITSEPSGFDESITNSEITYYEPPFELLKDVEIGRYITPYGIGFSLGSQGFTWIYDVTDYQKYLKGMVDLAAHNTQELIDLKFAFIEGTPPRDVHNVEPIWENWRSYNYGNLTDNVELAPTDIELSDTSSMFKIKTRFTGHGHNGNNVCCEWYPNDHKIIIDGVQRFSWNIWQPNECGENPNISQGGTWPYAREGWCPGDMVKEYDHEITSFVTPGDTVTIDYAISDITGSDPGSAGGNYVAALDLVSYSAPNFQHDAAVVDVLNPNSWEYYSKFNPTCSNPRVMIQNTGAQPLTSCVIRCWVTHGNWQEFEWSGNLGFLEKELVEIPITNPTFWYGTALDANDQATFNVDIYNVQGNPSLDEYANNNLMKVKFKAVEMIEGPFYVWFNTNNKANENKWKLIDANGATIFERTALTNTTDYKDTFDLAPGCYSIILEDSDHDGIGFWYSSQTEGETSGQFRLRKVGGGSIESFPADFGKFHRYDFSVGFTLGSDENGDIDENLVIAPNPATENVRAEFNGNLGNKVTIQLLDANGRVLKSEEVKPQGTLVGTDISVADLHSGLYFIRFTGNEGMKTAQFIKQ